MVEAHVVALSGGKDSTAMALWLSENEPRDYIYVCTPTGNELPEMEDHWRTLERHLGAPINQITARGLDLYSLIEAENAIPNWRMRFCTRRLKIEPFQAFMWKLAREYDAVTAYVGLRADEDTREGVLYPASRPGARDKTALPSIQQRFPLREQGMTLDDVLRFLRDRNIAIPERTDCGACFFQTLHEWWRLWSFYPEHYAQAEKVEIERGHTFRSDGRDTWPAALRDLRKTFEDGYVPKQRKRQSETCRACTL